MVIMVELVGEEIVVTRPRSTLLLAYRKLSDGAATCDDAKLDGKSLIFGDA
jgi:hypothetical protein